MALHHSPRIPTSGLVQLVDAANPKSYPGSGTTWYDLSVNNHDISLGSSVSLATYNSTKVMQFAETEIWVICENDVSPCTNCQNNL